LEDYGKQTAYIGATVGRFANRIKCGKFSLDGKEYKLYCNDGNNHLHGGKIGYDKRVWNASIIEGLTGQELQLSLVSPDMEEGYPGEVKLLVTFSLSEKNEMTLHYAGVTDKKTLLNLTNHCYYNLKGSKAGDITDHIVRINSKFYTVGNNESMPTGTIVPVAGTPMDFTTAHPIADHIDDTDYPDITYGKGYDHNFIIDKQYDSNTLEPVAEVFAKQTGIMMKVYSNQPAVQFYCGTCLQVDIPGKEGRVYGPRDGLCLETQVYPDSPNFAHFTSAVLNPGEQYNHVTTFAFSVEA
jgi:aldose 1-epimerase